MKKYFPLKQKNLSNINFFIFFLLDLTHEITSVLLLLLYQYNFIYHTNMLSVYFLAKFTS